MGFHLLIFILLFSCSSPVDKKYSPDTLITDIPELNKELSEKDMELIGGWIMRTDEVTLAGKTYSDILDDAKAYKIEQETLAKKARAEAAAKREKMQKAAIVSIFEKGFSEADWDEYNSFGYVFKNTSAKDIVAYEFSFTIFDALKNEIGDGYRISETETIVKSGQEHKTTVYFNHNKYIDDNVRLKNASYDNLTFEITVDKIVFNDGTSLD